MDFDKSIKYMQQIFRRMVLKKYKRVLAECKESTEGLAGYQWAMGATEDVTMEQF